MQFGLYAPVPHVTAGSKEIEQSIAGALSPLPPSEVDPAFALAREVLCAADGAGFDIILFAERHLGPDFEAWILAAAVSSWTRRIKTMTAVHPGLWHPTLVAKMAASLDRLTRGRTAINLVTGWNVEEHRMFGGDALLENDDRYLRAEEFVHVLRGMWSTSPFSYHGRFYQVERGAAAAAARDCRSARDLHCEPQPARARHGRANGGLVVPRLRQGRTERAAGDGQPAAVD